MDVGRTNLFQMKIPMIGLCIAQKTISNSIKVSQVFQQGNEAVRKCRLYIQKLSLWATLVIIVPKQPDPLNPQK